jgi:hypothetical protein
MTTTEIQPATPAHAAHEAPAARTGRATDTATATATTTATARATATTATARAQNLTLLVLLAGIFMTTLDSVTCISTEVT